ncbi:endonuclease/exonuclease/phosphatase family protein [Verrucomicrobiales bacterium]|nr:endonuclease/exonuclease/phosphatase family protein [Verrucomicrobiales bacterium]
MMVLLLIGNSSLPTLRAQKAPEPTKLRILCYNIHWALGMDGKYDVERIADVINKAKPDLVALQEVDVGVERSGRVHEAQRLSELTGMDVRMGPTQHYQGGLFGNAVLSRLPIKDVEIHPLPYTEETEELQTYPRGCVVVTVEAPNGKPLRFVSTHFQHNLPEDRVAQAHAINKLLAADDSGIPTILAGDMNAKPNEEPIQVLLKRWTNVINDPPAPTVPVKDPKYRIDYIFHRSSDSFKINETYVIDEKIASDHLPVFAELEWMSN